MDKLNFVTKVIDINVFSAYIGACKPKLDTIGSCHDCTVYWSVIPQIRQHCIKTMDLVVDKVIATVKWNVDETEYEEEEEGELCIDSELCGWNIFNNCHFHPDGAFNISEVTIDFEKKLITIE